MYHNDPIPHLPPRKVSLPLLSQSMAAEHSDESIDWGLPAPDNDVRADGILDWIEFRHHTNEYYIIKDKQVTLACDAFWTKNGTADTISEDPRCSSKHKILNLYNHLNYWNINYGPWC